jgi:hypothetical protein
VKIVAPARSLPRSKEAVDIELLLFFVASRDSLEQQIARFRFGMTRLGAGTKALEHVRKCAARSRRPSTNAR